MQPRAGATLRDSITRLALPMPLEVLVFRALNAEGVDGKHERLVYAWEVAIQIAATSAWAACRHLELRSDTLDAVMPKLARPMFGHWLELLRAARALLATRSEAAAIALRPLLEGLESKYAADERLVALARRISALPKRNAKIGGSTIGALLDAIPVYRNETRGHGEPDTKFREESLEAILGGLVAFCELARPTGAFRVVVVDRLEQRDDTHLVELASMEGAQVLVESHTISSTLRKTLSPARPYLHAAPDLFVPLFPAAAGHRGEDGWALGWLKQQVRMPTLSFESSVAGAFSLAVADDDYASLLRAKDAPGEEVSEALLDMDPWRGLLVYEEAHAGLFFGRAALTLETMSHLERRGVAVLCGASGSGKSSLMRAGLLPALRERAKERERDVVTMLFVPGSRPIEALRRAALGAFQGDGMETMRWSREVEDLLPDDVAQVRPDALVHIVRGLAAGGHHVALLVDQLEEVTTLCADAGERDRFLDLLTTLATRLEPHEASLILTIRADKLDAVLEHAAMRSLLERALKPIGTMGRDELVEVITRPLQGRRVKIEPGLPERILADVGEEPGGLALVSQLLSVLWDARGRFGDELTLAGYEAVGGVMGVLGRQADEARAEAMGSGDAAKARGVAVDQVFLRLAHRGDDGRFTRRRVPLATLAQALDVAPAKLEEQLASFVARRLLVVSAAIAEGDIAAPQEVEVAHEALLRGWPALKELLEREGEVTALRQEVERAAGVWERSVRRSELWSDATSNLKRAEELVASGKMLLAERERAFLAGSRRAVTRTKRLARFGVAMISLLAVVVAALGWQANKLLQTSRHLELLGRRSLREALVAQATLVNPDPAHRADALLAGLRAAQLDLVANGSVTPEVECALGLAVSHSGRLVRSLALEGDDDVKGASFSPDGTRVVTASHDNTARIWDSRTGAQLARLEHGGSVTAASFSPDGARVVTAGWDKTARVWDAKTGAQLVRLEHDGGVWAASFSRDGTRVVTASEDKTARVWDAKTGTQLTRVEHDAGVWAASFSQDGARVVTASGDKTARVWDAKTGAQLARLEHGAAVGAASFSPDGLRVVTASKDKAARIWDATAGTQLARLEHEDEVRTASFSPDGTRVVTTSKDETARIWDARTGAQLARLEHGDMTAASFSPDGTRVVTSSGDKTARVWDARTGVQLARLEHDDVVWGASFSQDGTRVVTASRDRTARIWDAQSGTQSPRLEHKGPVQAVCFSPDGTRIVTASDKDDAARIWDAKTGAQLARLAHGDKVDAASFSPDGTRVLTASEDKTARIWDAKTGLQLTRLDHAKALTANTGMVVGAGAQSFSPDGARVVTASEDKTARIWDAKTGAQVARLEHEGVVWAAFFSPDGTRVVTASGDKTARIWDASTGVQLARLEHGDTVGAASFSPDGTRVVTASWDKTARIWDAKTGLQLAQLQHGSFVRTASFSPDGALVVTASHDNTARVWDAKTGLQLTRLDHGGSVTSASFSPDGARVVTASWDKTARIWDAKTGLQLARLEHDGGVWAAFFSPDGTRVVTASADQTAHIWAVTLDAYLTGACIAVRRRRELPEFELLCAPYLAKADATPPAW